MTLFSINTIMFFIIVAIVELIKRLDKKSFLKPIYVFLPLLISALMSFLTVEELTVKNYFYSLVIYTSVSAYAYDLIKKTLDNMILKIFGAENDKN